tara:strand:- start:147 stop:287 length:141 start_codon:yes stop_codon:yes gene_type:complete
MLKAIILAFLRGEVIRGEVRVRFRLSARLDSYYPKPYDGILFGVLI